jgi:hypothetical protein
LVNTGGFVLPNSKDWLPFPADRGSRKPFQNYYGTYLKIAHIPSAIPITKSVNRIEKNATYVKVIMLFLVIDITHTGSEADQKRHDCYQDECWHGK